MCSLGTWWRRVSGGARSLLAVAVHLERLAGECTVDPPVRTVTGIAQYNKLGLEVLTVLFLTVKTGST